MGIFKVVTCANLIFNLVFNISKHGASNDETFVKKIIILPHCL